MAITRSVASRIEKLTRPSSSESHTELRYLRERVIYSFILIGISLGSFVMVFGLIMSLKEGFFSLAISNLALYVWVWVLFIFRTIPYFLRLFTSIVITYVIGVEVLIITGTFGAGITWLFFVPIAAAILTEIRWALLALLVNALTLIGVSGLATSSALDWTFNNVMPIEAWVEIILNFVLLNVIATLSISMIVAGLEKSLKNNKQIVSELELKNSQFKETNQKLATAIDANQTAQTNLQRTEKALRDHEIRFWELVNFLPLGYFLTDNELIVRFLNARLEADYSVSDSVIDLPFEHGLVNTYTFSDRSRILDRLKKGLAGETTNWETYSLFDNRFREITVETHLTPIRQNNVIVGVQGLIVDITDRLDKDRLKLAKDVAEQTNVAISDWLSFIAHEIRTPLGVPVSYARLGIDKLKKVRPFNSISELKEHIESDTRLDINTKQSLVSGVHGVREETDKIVNSVTDYFERILSSSNRLNELLNDLLDLSKLESGQMTFNFYSANVADIVREIHYEYEATLTNNGLKLVVEDTDLNTVVECDAFRIGQLFHNLLSNAMKFSRRGGVITISFAAGEKRLGRREGDPVAPTIKIMVKDEGIGIPEDQLTFVFNKFKQSRKSRTGEGTGLGLAICKEIVTAHGGTISVESEENKGSSFTIELPTRQQRAVNAT